MVKEILIVAITRMGDMLQASATLAGLKQKYPDAKTTVLIEQQFASICEGIPGIDEVFPVDLSLVVQGLNREGEGIVDAYRYFEEVLSTLRERKFDMCLNLASSAYTALLIRLLEIPDNRGWVSDDEGYRLIENPWSMLFAAFVYHSNRDFNSINLVDIMRCSAGVSEHPRNLIFNIPERSKSFPEQWYQAKGIDRKTGPVIGIQAGASQGKRQWSPAKFGYLARLLIEELGATVVLTGAKSELPITEAILKHYSHPRLHTSVGETDLGQLAALLNSMDLLVTGDTGPMHMAVAVGTPVVALFLASALCFETGPYGTGHLVIQPQIHCNPCNPNFPCARPDCHDQISPNLVAQLVKLRLGTSAEKVSELKVDANPAEVVIYGTHFDEEGFLDFKPLNGLAERKGLPANYYQRTRDSYRSVWKSEFGEELLIPHRRPVAQISAPADKIESSLKTIVELCQLGEHKLAELERCIADKTVPARVLGEKNAEVIQTDRMLEDLGHAEGALGALVRMFVMEKENLRGDDPFELVAATKALYQGLRRRSLLFFEAYKGANNEL